MDVQRAHLLLCHLNCSTNYLLHQKSLEEMREAFILTMELEDTKAKSQDQIKLRDAKIIQLREMLRVAIKERNLAQDNYHQLMLLQYQNPNSTVSTFEEEDPVTGNFSSSDADESTVSSPPPPPPHTHDLPVPVSKPLPEKGKLLEAVVKAGPLLKNLLIAGPLPQWRHPPPPIDCYKIPPVTGNMDGIRLNRLKRGVPDEEGMDFAGAGEVKFQRVALLQ